MEWDFIANATVDTLDIVPDTVRGYYEEDKANGRFIVKSDIKPLAEAFTGANKRLGALTKQKKDDNNKDAARRLVIDGITTKLTEMGIEVGDDPAKLADVISTKITELMDTVKGGKEVKTNLDAIKKDFDKRVLDITTKKDGELAIMQSSLARYMVNSAAATELASAGTVEKGTDLLMPLISKSAKVIKDDSGEYAVRVVDAEGNVRMNNRGENMSIKDLVGEMKLAYPMAFKSESKGGSGVPPGTGKRAASTPAPKGGEDDRTSIQKISAGLAKMQQGNR